MVLPCVPATASTWRLVSLLGQPFAGRWYGARPRPEWPPSAGISGCHRPMRALTTLPTTNMSGASASCLGAIALDQLHAQRAQLVAHRRVDAASHGDAADPPARQGGQAAHESAANA